MIEFSQCVARIGSFLYGETNVTLGDVEQDASYHDAFQGIWTTPEKRRDRDYKTVQNDVLRGKAAEIGVAKLLPYATVCSDKWVIEDRTTYAQDIIYDGIRLEIKSHFGYNWFKMPLQGYRVMMTNRDQGLFDALLFARVTDAETGGFKVKPSILIDPYPTGIVGFKDLWSPWWPSEEMKKKDPVGTHRVFNGDAALKRNLAYSYMEEENV